MQTPKIKIYDMMSERTEGDENNTLYFDTKINCKDFNWPTNIFIAAQPIKISQSSYT
jgi:hypothetical protein